MGPKKQAKGDAGKGGKQKGGDAKKGGDKKQAEASAPKEKKGGVNSVKVNISILQNYV